MLKIITKIAYYYDLYIRILVLNSVTVKYKREKIFHDNKI